MNPSPTNQPADSRLREQLLEEYIKVARGFYFEGSDEESERQGYGPEWVEKIMQLFDRYSQEIAREAIREEMEELLTMCLTNYEATRNGDMKALAAYCANRIMQLTQQPAEGER